MNKFLNFILYLSIMLYSLTLISCATSPVGPKEWTPKQQNDQVVWSDDGAEVAVIILSFEEKQASVGNGTTDKRNFKHQVFVQNVDGSQRRAITQLRDAQNGSLFYMKQAGYLIVESLLESGARQIDKIGLDGKEILIIETPDRDHQPCKTVDAPPKQVHHTVIPSPDGRQLAHIYSQECGEVTVEFLYANNLNLITSHTMPLEASLTPTWHREGYLILVANTGDKAWKVTVQEPPIAITPPKCLTPTTTSSNISLSGKMVYFDETGKLLTKEVGSDGTFGCQ